MSIREPFGSWLRWKLVRWLEPQIQTLITKRILLYHERLTNDGFIQDLRPPYLRKALPKSLEMAGHQ